MPRPANPEVRARLLSIGQQIVHSRGFNGCGVQEITAAAGVPKGSFYNYFDSKEAFAIEILEEYWSLIEKSHGSILYDARIKPLERIAKYFSALTDSHEQQNFTLGCLIGNLALELADASAETRRKLAYLLNRWEASLAECLREAQVRNELAAERDAKELAAALIEAWEGAVMRGKVDQGRGAYHRFETFVLPSLIA